MAQLEVERSSGCDIHGHQSRDELKLPRGSRGYQDVRQKTAIRLNLQSSMVPLTESQSAKSSS